MEVYMNKLEKSLKGLDLSTGLAYISLVEKISSIGVPDHPNWGKISFRRKADYTATYVAGKEVVRHLNK